MALSAFEHSEHADDPPLTYSFDLLWKGIEITTGAQREHRYDVLVKQAEEKGMDIGPLSSYLTSFRYGTPPHGGLGAELNRILMIMLGLDSIREATFLSAGQTASNRSSPSLGLASTIMSACSTAAAIATARGKSTPRTPNPANTARRRRQQHWWCGRRSFSAIAVF